MRIQDGRLGRPGPISFISIGGSGGEEGEIRGEGPGTLPRGSKLFHFHAVFSKGIVK